jgi:hypothetical protein
MSWNVYFHADVDPEYEALDQEVQDDLLANLKLLEMFGPQRHANMKELRFAAADGV